MTVNSLTEKYSSAQWPLVQSISQQTDKWAKQPSHMACTMEDLKVEDTNYGHKAKDIKQFPAWRREV